MFLVDASTVCDLEAALRPHVVLKAWLLTTAAAALLAAVAQALRIALRQPAVAADPYVLYAAASTCSDWQPAVQLGSFDVKVRVQPSLTQLQRLVSWLPKHADYVRSLSIHLDEDAVYELYPRDTDQIQELLHRAEELLLQALQQPQQSQAAEPAAGANASSETALDDLSDLLAAAAIADSAAPSAAAAGGLRLTSFSSNCITAAGARVLLLLPAHTLTRLELRVLQYQPQAGARADIHDWCAGLARFTNLQHLHLNLDTDTSSYGPASGELEALQSSIAEECLAGIAQRSSLTTLDLSIRASDAWGVDGGSEHIAQQAIARQLQLRLLQLHVSPASGWRDTGGYYSPGLNLASLTQLGELHLYELSEQTVLPRQLQQLHIETCQLTRHDIYYLASLPQLQQLCISHCNPSDVAGLTALSGLQNFSCEIWDYNQDELQGLAQVPLQNLALRYLNVPRTAAATAAAWSKLSLLQELHLFTWNYQPSKQQMSSILAGLTACSSLTKLTFDGSYSPLLDFVDNPDDLFLNPEQMAVVQQLADAAAAATGPVSVCSSLAVLSGLRDLTLSYAFGVPGHHRGEALALTALTGLTRLVLADAGAAVDDHAATSLASNLRQLRHLDLSRCDLGDMVCVEAIGQTLTQLTELQLRGSGRMTRV
jgi:hypothetical protein